ncbi:MAG: ATP-dependent nuclease [Pseudomonadota bacterium]|jgi:predicted ATP-dependent endonuclease of OLD family
MKLASIRVQNFRTLEDMTVRFNGFYTAISGQNNAGKTTLLRAIRHTFRDNSREIYFYRRRDEITYRDDRTQWAKKDEDIVFHYVVTVSPTEDPGLFQFIERFNEEKLPESDAKLQVQVTHRASDETTCICWVNEKELSTYASKEVLQKLKSSNLAFMHDSAQAFSPIYGAGGRHLHELTFTADELNEISQELARVQTKIKKISKAHKTELSQLLGHLEEKYEVDFSIPEGMFTGSIPFAVNLRDKNVDIPLNDWGSGTKNRTQIMMSILQATRIRSKPDENKITPIILIEEPESFLHPSAQAEFGRVLIDLANELQIQTVVTTHSPYMLCQSNVQSNVLLGRKTSYGKTKSTEVIEVKDDNWMEPFGSILGLNNAEFSPWKDVLFSGKQCVLLVEGEIDKSYFEAINLLGFADLVLPQGLEIVAYEGKDALKNSILLKFIIDKFKKVLVTFDLDAKSELERTMTQVGLAEGAGFLAIGSNKPGKQCIEGLLPDRILSKVYSANTDLVMALTSAENRDRKSAKSALKQRLLAEFKCDKSIVRDDLKLFLPVFKALSRLAPE